MDFLYGELNKLVEKQVYQGKNTDTASVDVDNVDSTISVKVNLDKVASREYVENRTKDLVGPAGKSAYEIAVDNGFIGTEEEWLASLSSAAAPIYVTSVEEMTNTSQMYVMPDNHIWAYAKTTIGKEPVNLFDINAQNNHKDSRIHWANDRAESSPESVAGAEFNENFYNKDSNPLGIRMPQKGSLVTDYLATDLSSLGNNYNLTIKGYGTDSEEATILIKNAGGAGIMFFDEDKKFISSTILYSGSSWNFNTVEEVNGNNKYVKIDLSSLKVVYGPLNNQGATVELPKILANTEYIRLGFSINGVTEALTDNDLTDLSISLDAQDKSIEGYAWIDTGILYANSSVTKTSIQNALGYVPESESNKVEDYNPDDIYTNKQFLSATATENLLSQSHNIVAVDVTYNDGSSETFEIWANKR